MPRYIDAENIRYTTEQPYKSVVRRVIIQQPTAPAICPADDDFGAALNCAVRYGLEHRYRLPWPVMDFITPLLPYLSDRTLDVFAHDIGAAERRGELSHPRLDAGVFLRFLETVRSERERRSNGN